MMLKGMKNITTTVVVMMSNENEIEYETLYLFLSASTNKLYAWTQDKNYRDRFREERNMKLFTYKKEVHSTATIGAFRYRYKDQMLTSIIIGNEEKTFEVIGTYAESIDYDSCESYISNICESNFTIAKYIADNRILDKKYIDPLLAITQSYVIKKVAGEKTALSTLDQFHIFYKLFGHMFNHGSNKTNNGFEL